MNCNKTFKIDVPSGWFSLLSKMIEKIEKIDSKGNVEIKEAREENGELKIYYTTSDDIELTIKSKIDKIIYFTIIEADYTCVECGSRHGYFKTKDHVYPFCIDCAILLYESEYQPHGIKFSECFDIDI